MWGAMDKLLSDSAKTEISNKVMDILRAYHISNWHSEPYHQNQNPAEWRYRTIKSWTNTVMNRSGTPANCWLLCLIYVCYLLNHIACSALDGKIPLLALTGITPDISIILLFTFYQPVFYATYDQHFPSESEERAGYWVGFGEHCGDAMTHKILDQHTQKLIYRSAVRPKKSSRFRAAPRQGHMDRLKRIYSYAIRTKDYAIRFRTEQPDYSFLPDQDFDWTYSIYGNVQEILPDDMPDPLGKAVTTTTTMDANLNHCLATSKSLTGFFHFVNKTPVDWYSKKQATVETATYGSEFVAAKTATEQIMDIRQTLRYLGAPISAKFFLCCDNRSVDTSATLRQSTLTKRHNILAFHRVREAIAAKLMAFYWIQSAYNLSDMLSKHWNHLTVYPMILKL